MTWDSLDTYRAGLDFFTAVVDGVPAGSWQRPSPCERWRALDVLGHVGQTTEMGARILQGGEIRFDPADPPGAAVGDDPVAWWRRLAHAARVALDGVEDLDRVVESPAGPRTVRDGLSFPAVDLFVHGWDLAAATGESVTIPDEAIAFIRAMFEHVPDGVARQPGVFAPRLDAPADASPTDALIAFTGRDPSWATVG